MVKLKGSTINKYRAKYCKRCDSLVKVVDGSPKCPNHGRLGNEEIYKE